MELITVLLLTLGLFYFLYYNFVLKRRNLPPGPTPWPFLGNIHQVDLKALHKTLDKWGQKYGPIYTVWMGENPGIVFCDYQLMKEHIIYGKNRDAFTGRPEHLALEHFNGGKLGIFLTTGPMWKEQRRFTLHVLRDFGFGRNLMEEKIRVQVQNLVDHVGELMEQEKAIGSKFTDISEPIKLSVASVLGAVLFGHSYTQNDQRFREIIDMLDEETKLMLRPDVILLQVLPWLRHIPLFGHFGFDRVAELFDRFLSFMRREISEHKATFSHEKPAEDFINAYLLEIYNREKDGNGLGYFSEEQLGKLLGDLLVAGMETTIATLKYGILFALHNPDAQAKVHAEMEEFYRKTGVQPGTTMAHRQLLPYTAAYVNETQRLTNALPLNFPHALTRDLCVEGYKIKEGTIVFPQISSVMQNPETFPEPEEFRPERFLDQEGKLRKIEELVPFSVGKRNCVGESLAKTEVFMSFAALFWNFHFAKADVLPGVEPIIGMVVQPQPFKTLVTRRLDPTFYDNRTLA